MGEEISHSFHEQRSMMQKAKSTSNLLELPLEEETKSSSGFLSKFKNLFKKRDTVALGPGPSENRIFGNSIKSLAKSKEHDNVPSFVVACVKKLETPEMITTHGLYRASGNKVTIDEVKRKVRINVKIYHNF